MEAHRCAVFFERPKTRFDLISIYTGPVPSAEEVAAADAWNKANYNR